MDCPSITQHGATALPDGSRVRKNAGLLAPTIFHQGWWLDVATKGQFETVEVREDGRVVGRLPFWRNRRSGLQSCNMPPFTHFLGPAVDPGSGHHTARYLRQLSITAALVAKLPPVASFRQKMHRGVMDLLPFQAAGFDASVQFTYEILADAEAVAWDAMRDKTRNAIRNGEKFYTISWEFEPDAFIAFYRNNLAARGQKENVDLSIGRISSGVAWRKAVDSFLWRESFPGRRKRPFLSFGTGAHAIT